MRHSPLFLELPKSYLDIFFGARQFIAGGTVVELVARNGMVMEVTRRNPMGNTFIECDEPSHSFVFFCLDQRQQSDTTGRSPGVVCDALDGLSFVGFCHGFQVLRIADVRTVKTEVVYES